MKPESIKATLDAQGPRIANRRRARIEEQDPTTGEWREFRGAIDQHPEPTAPLNEDPHRLRWLAVSLLLFAAAAFVVAVSR